MLRERVQTEALRTYLFAYGLHYSSVSQDQLAASFQLPDKKVGRPLGAAAVICFAFREHVTCKPVCLASADVACLNS